MGERTAQRALAELLAHLNVVAQSMNLLMPPAQSTRAFLESVLVTSQDEGGRELWACHAQGIITDYELCSGTMQRCVTWLAGENDIDESRVWELAGPDVERGFSRALLGHDAT